MADLQSTIREAQAICARHAYEGPCVHVAMFDAAGPKGLHECLGVFAAAVGVEIEDSVAGRHPIHHWWDTHTAADRAAAFDRAAEMAGGVP